MHVPPPILVELIYRVEPNVLKSDIHVHTGLSGLIKDKAAERVARGEPLTFRFSSMGGLINIDVKPKDAHASLPRKGGNIEFRVHRADATAGSQALEKHLETILHSETIYPNDAALARFAGLVGLNRVKERVLIMLEMLFSNRRVVEWSERHHCPAQADHLLKDRPYPVFVFEGPPGVGKTDLSGSIGGPLACALSMPVISYKVSLTLRGAGLVGELSQNIHKLFAFAKTRHLERGAPVLLLIDEADAIAQKRDGKQSQHHEEQVGVNTLLQEIDGLRDTSGVACIFTTNLYDALDTAIRKRTNAHWIHFPLPGAGVRFYLLQRFLGDVLSPLELRQLAKATGGFAPRDLVELYRAARYDAIATMRPLTLNLLLRTATSLSEPSSSQSSGEENTTPRMLLTEQGLPVNGHKPTNAAA